MWKSRKTVEKPTFFDTHLHNFRYYVTLQFVNATKIYLTIIVDLYKGLMYNIKKAVIK